MKGSMKTGEKRIPKVGRGREKGEGRKNAIRDQRGERKGRKKRKKPHRAKVESQRGESIDKEIRVVVRRGQRKWV